MRSITDFFTRTDSKTTVPPAHSLAPFKAPAQECIVVIEDDEDTVPAALSTDSSPSHAPEKESDSVTMLKVTADCTNVGVFSLLGSQTSRPKENEPPDACLISSDSSASKSQSDAYSSSASESSESDCDAERPRPVAGIQEITFDTFRSNMEEPLAAADARPPSPTPPATPKLAALFDPSTWGGRRSVTESPPKSAEQRLPRRRGRPPSSAKLAAETSPKPQTTTTTEPAPSTMSSKRPTALSAADRARFFATDFRPPAMKKSAANSTTPIGDLPCPWPASWNAHVGWQPLPSNSKLGYSFRESDQDGDDELQPTSWDSSSRLFVLGSNDDADDGSGCLATVRLNRLAKGDASLATIVADVEADLPDAERRLAGLTSALAVARDSGEVRQRSLADLLAPRCVADMVDAGDDPRRLADWLEGWDRRQKLLRRERARKRRRRRGLVDSGSDDGSDSYYDDDDTSDSESGDLEAEAKAALVEGPGKTCLAYALAAQLGLQVFEVNSGERRQGKQLLDRLQEAAICSQVGRQRLDAAPALPANIPSTASGKKRRSTVAMATDKRQSKRLRRDGPSAMVKAVDSPALSHVTVTNACLLLFDDADTLLEDEAGFHRLLASVCSVARKPALVAVRSAASFRRQQLASGGAGHQLTAGAPLFRLRPAAPVAVAAFARLVAAALGWQLSAEGAASLASHCGQRLGRLLHLLHYQLHPGEADSVEFRLATGEPLNLSPLARMSNDNLALNDSQRPPRVSLDALADAADAGRLADRLRRRLEPDCCDAGAGVADELPIDGFVAGVDFAGELGEAQCRWLLTNSVAVARRRLGVVAMATAGASGRRPSDVSSTCVADLDRDLNRRSAGRFERLDVAAFLRYTAWLHSTVAEAADVSSSSRRRTRAAGLAPLMYTDQIGLPIGAEGKRYLAELGCRLMSGC